MMEDRKDQGMFTTEEAARYLRVSVATMRAYVKTEQVKAAKVGSRYYFAEDDLLRLLNEGTDERYSAYVAELAAKRNAGVTARKQQQQAPTNESTLRVRRMLRVMWKLGAEFAREADSMRAELMAMPKPEATRRLADTFERIAGAKGVSWDCSWLQMARAWFDEVGR